MSEEPVSLRSSVRTDLSGRFNELDVLRRQWPLFAATVEGQVLPPYEVLIHPSSGCNLRCQWCIGDHVPLEIWDDEREMLTLVDASKEAPDRLPDTLGEPAAMMKLVRDLVGYRKTGSYLSRGRRHTREFRVQNVSFSGLIGEPLISRAALIPAIGYLIHNDVRVGLFTNGELMDAKVIDVLVHSAYVNVSLDAASADTYAALKFHGHKAGEVKFDRVVANLRALADRRRLDHTDVEIGVSFILYPENYHEVYDVAVLAREAGADRLRLKRDISGARLLDATQVDDANALIARIRDELVDDMFELVEIHKLDYEGALTRQFSTCSITDMSAAVGSDGHLYPCNYHPRPGGASYGSAIDTSFAQVWEGLMRARLRGELPSICPNVCDPFKNRANTMLAVGKTIVTEHGLDYLERDVIELVGARTYDTSHGRHQNR
jgi:MoaA/NifB/PqqE/SkfB family radical SAM enzyme